MSRKTNDITDNEIRIITANEPKVQRRRNKFLRVYLPIITLVLLLAIICWIFIPTADNTEENLMSQNNDELIINKPLIEHDEPTVNVKGSIIVVDTVINKKGLLILYPENLQPRLVLGSDKLNDSGILIATQAADIRGDNGQIAGTFVLNGELISKGEAKAGYCSIINGELSIGVADATPMLEQTLTEGGYFFRQYPLVVGGQIVENKPKGKSIRKALAEIEGRKCVVMSKERLTFHDFSQLLMDAGARNAIYLVGSTSYGFYINEMDRKVEIGNAPATDTKYINYLIWEQIKN